MKMNLIVLSHLYTKRKAPYYGTFVEQQVQALKNKINGSITVISPTPWSPRLLWFKKKWREYGQVERGKTEKLIKVYYPRYLVIPVKFFSPLEGVFMYLSVRSLIKKRIKANKSRIILHAHTIMPDGLAAIFLKNELSIKIVCTAHGSDINLYPFETRLTYLMTKYVLKRADRLVAVSQKLKEKIQKIAYRNDVKVVTNGVNPEMVVKNDVKRNRHNPRKDDTCTILFVGELCFEKGIRELLHAFKLLKIEYNHLYLIMVGKNTVSQWIRSFIKENQLLGSIKLTGPVDYKFINNYYARASIFVLPSHSEGMPTVMFEAMANKLPIVISRVGGVEEVIKDGFNGLLVDPGSEKDLYKKLKLMIEEEALRDKFGKNAYYDVLSKYTWDHNADKMRFIYKGLLGL